MQHQPGQLRVLEGRSTGVRLPPIERPATTTLLASGRRAAGTAASASADQSAQPVRLHLLDGGPVAGQAGQLDREAGGGERLGHAAASSSGLPVKPWRHRAPAGPPSADHGSAPGRSEFVIRRRV